MKSIREIHANVVMREECTSREAAALIGSWVDRSDWAVYKWLKKEPNLTIRGYLNMRYQDYLEEKDNA